MNLMSLPRETFATGELDCDFSMEMPVGFCSPHLPQAMPAFTDPHATQRLMMQSSPIVESSLWVLGRPAYDTGDVTAWLQRLLAHQGVTLERSEPGQVGGLLRWHPAVLATGLQARAGDRLRISAVLLEDGGRLLLAQATADEAIAGDYLPTLEHCIRTLELADARGPTAPLIADGETPVIQRIEHDPQLPPPRDANEVWARAMKKKRDAAVAQAQPLLNAGQYDEAERLVQAADSSAQGAVALGRLYTAALQRLVSTGQHRRERDLAHRLFDRALRWKLAAYPDPHTSYEARSFADGQAQDRAELVDILGYDPTR
jgi:hypothetical protein